MTVNGLMKMKTKMHVYSENGNILTTPSSGIIVQGNIYKPIVDEDGVPELEYAITGDNFPNQSSPFYRYDVNLQAYTWEELIDLLDIPIRDLRNAVKKRETNIR